MNKCGNTGQLRVNPGINDPVSSCSRAPLSAHPVPCTMNLESIEDEPKDDLDTLQVKVLKHLVKSLRRGADLNKNTTE